MILLTAIVVLPVMTLYAFGSDSPATVRLPVKISLAENSANAQKRAQLILTPVNGAPMPYGNGGEGISSSVAVPSATELSLSFDSPGEYEYSVSVIYDGATVTPEKLSLFVSVTKLKGTLTPVVTVVRDDGVKCDLEFEILIKTSDPPHPPPWTGERLKSVYLIMIMATSLLGIVLIFKSGRRRHCDKGK